MPVALAPGHRVRQRSKDGAAAPAVALGHLAWRTSLTLAGSMADGHVESASHGRRSSGATLLLFGIPNTRTVPRLTPA